LDELGDVRNTKNKLGMDNTYEAESPVTTIHETTHGIDSKLRNRPYGSGTSNEMDFYLFNGQYIGFKTSKITAQQVDPYIPQELKNYKIPLKNNPGVPDFWPYNEYIQNRIFKDWNDQPGVIVDELDAYTNGAFYSGSGDYKSLYVLPFVGFSLSYAKAIQQTDPNYWNSAEGQKFRDALGFMINRAIQAETAQRNRLKDPNQNPENTRNDLNKLLNTDLKNFKDKYFADCSNPVTSPVNPPIANQVPNPNCKKSSSDKNNNGYCQSQSYNGLQNGGTFNIGACGDASASSSSSSLGSAKPKSIFESIIDNLKKFFGLKSSA
jgi:hypothetical protein